MNKSMLIILDGWGKAKDPERSAIDAAKTPFIDRLYEDYPHAELITYGEEVGLPKGQMGNSEVGHLNIGAGRVVYQELERINKALREKTFQNNTVFQSLVDLAKKESKKVHLLGLLSDGGVHSHIDHIFGISDLLNAEGIETYLHAFTDGRDVDPKSGFGFIKQFQDKFQGSHVQLASIVGRYFAMDRDNRWERIQKAYDALVKGIGTTTLNPLKVIQESYESGKTDEFLEPIIILNHNKKPITTISNDDIVFFVNFRTDRPRQLTLALSQGDLSEKGMPPLDLHFFTMTRYDQSYKGVKPIFTKDEIVKTLGEVIEENKLTQVRIAETEKYPHVTFFFSGGREKEFEREKRILVPSPKVATYDLAPEMSAEGITTAIIDELKKNQPDFVCLNFANTDMVGHTGDFEAAKKAASIVDNCLKRIVEVANKMEYISIIIADHGNSDYMINDDGSPHTAHTINPVPIFIVSKNKDLQVKNGKLGDVAPTILSLMGIHIPDEMTGNVIAE